MNRYEVLILAAPTVTEDEGRSLEKGFEQLVKGVKGEIISFECWGKYRLAYPVRKNDFGVYFLVRFSVVDSAKAFFKDVDTYFSVRNHELVMRHCTVKLEAKQSLEYKRPLNVEETPAHDAEGNSFGKEGREFRRGPRREYGARNDEGFSSRSEGYTHRGQQARESSHEEAADVATTHDSVEESMSEGV